MTGAEKGFTWTEQHRHACEVRHVLALPSRELRAEYLEAVDKRRGPEAGQRLRDDVAAAWAAARAAAKGG